jgi:hypothetical protein
MFRRRPYRQCAVTRLNELSFSDLRQRPRLAYHSHGPGTREATIHLVDNALPNHQQGRKPPCAPTPACRTPSHDRLHQRQRESPGSPKPGPLAFLNPARHHRREHLAADPSPQVTRPLDLFPTEETLQAEEVLFNGLRIRAKCHSECHSRQVRHSVLNSKNCHDLRAPLRNRTVDLLLTMETLCRLS